MAIQSINLQPKVKKGGGLLGKILGGVLGTIAGAVAGAFTAGAGAAPAAAGTQAAISGGTAALGALKGAALGAGVGSMGGGLIGEGISPGGVEERTPIQPLERRANIDPEVQVARLQEAQTALKATPGIPAEEATQADSMFEQAKARLQEAKKAQMSLGGVPDWRAEEEMRRKRGLISS